MNTLNIEKNLAQKYGYRPLPSELSDNYRNFYKENIPSFLNIDGGGHLYTSYGTLICERYNRIVIGDYGAFVEFSKPACDLIIAPGQEYRVNDERYSKNVKYIWLTTADRSKIKIYHQKRTVKYADYKRGMYYVSVHEVADSNWYDNKTNI